MLHPWNLALVTASMSVGIVDPPKILEVWGTSHVNQYTKTWSPQNFDHATLGADQYFSRQQSRRYSNVSEKDHIIFQCKTSGRNKFEWDSRGQIHGSPQIFLCVVAFVNKGGRIIQCLPIQKNCTLQQNPMTSDRKPHGSLTNNALFLNNHIYVFYVFFWVWPFAKMELLRLPVFPLWIAPYLISSLIGGCWRNCETACFTQTQTHDFRLSWTDRSSKKRPKKWSSEAPVTALRSSVACLQSPHGKSDLLLAAWLWKKP